MTRGNILNFLSTLRLTNIAQPPNGVKVFFLAFWKEKRNFFLRSVAFSCLCFALCGMLKIQMNSERTLFMKKKGKVKGRGKTKSLRFETTRAEKRRKTALTWLAFVATVLLVAAVSLSVYLSKSGYFEARKELSESNIKKEVTILVASSDSDGELVYLSWLTANTRRQTFRITAVSPKDSYQGQTFTEIYGGEKANDVSCKQLKEAVADKYHVKLDRYIILPESSYPRLLNTLGNYTINLDTEVAYDGDDYSIHILTGERTLTGARFFNYLCYVGENYNAAALKNQANLMADFLRQELTEKNAKNAQSLFESLSNYILTDISTAEFAQYKDFLVLCSQQPSPDIAVK